MKFIAKNKDENRIVNKKNYSKLKAKGNIQFRIFFFHNERIYKNLKMDV